MPPLVPEAFTLDPVAAKAIRAEWLTDEERAELRVFHGTWDQRDLSTPRARAMVALHPKRNRGLALFARFGNPSRNRKSLNVL